MTKRYTLGEEISWLLVALATLSAIGWVFDSPILFPALGLGAYATWNLYQLFRLYNWLNDGSIAEPPTSHGLWGEVFNQIYYLQRKQRRRHNKLTLMLGRYRESTSAMPDASVIVGANWEIEWFNQASQDLLGLKPDKDVGQVVTNLIRSPAFNTFIQEDVTDKVLEITSPLNEDVILSLRVIPYAKNQRLIIANDITRLHRLEEIRKDFVANVSHELRTPLTVLAGYLETMVDTSEEGEMWHNSYRSMQRQTSRMQQIVEDLLILSRLESNEENVDGLESVAVPAMAAALVEEAELLSDGQHKIISEIEQNLWLKGKPNELRSALTNLVTNAVRYTPEGGTIHIRWFEDSQGAHFSVKDDGEGIAQQHIPRLTERFYRVDVGRSRDQGGTGLGLAIVKHVLMRHKARLDIKSSLGHGSLFSCDFPLSMIDRPLSHQPDVA